MLNSLLKKCSQQKRAALAERFDILNKSVLADHYHCPLIKTYNQQKIQSKKKSSQKEELSSEEKEIIETQEGIRKLIEDHNLLENAIFENDEIQNMNILDKIFEVENLQLEVLLDRVAYKNNLIGELKSKSLYPLKDCNSSEADCLIYQFSQQEDYDLQLLEQIEKEVQQLQKDNQIMKEQERSLDLRLQELSQNEQNIKIQRYEQKKQLKSKQFSLQIIQEQYFTYKKQIRTCLLFNCKRVEYDQNYEPYIKLKNSKQVTFEHKDILNDTSQLLYSDSKSKAKKVYNYRPNNLIKFDTIYQRKEIMNYNNETPYQTLYQNIELFIKGVLYKQINQIHKNLAFNSQEYQLIYEQDFNESIDKVKRICCRDGKDAQNNLIIYLSDKNRGNISELINDIIKTLQHFNNHIVEVNDININIQSFQIKDNNCEDIYDGPLINELTQLLNQLPLFDKAQYHIKIDLLINNSFKRQINILALCPQIIENQELFCKQFKTTFKREKGFKEQLGSKVESILKSCDKCVIIVEIPEMIKLNGKHTAKLTKIKAIMEFYQQLLLKKFQ